MNERSLSTVQDLQDGKWAGGASARNGMNVTMLTGDSQVYTPPLPSHDLFYHQGSS